MKWTDTKIDTPPSIVWRTLTAKRDSDNYGWMTLKELQSVTQVPRDVLRAIMFRFLSDGSAERTGVRGKRCFYRKK